MKLKFCGAAREVTGSCHLITLESGFTILLDCGLYQGGDRSMGEFNQTWLFDPRKIDCLIVSHAHIDHTGRIPKLVADGFRGQIFATHATRDLCAIMLMDSAKIQEGDAERDNRHLQEGEKERQPLYTMADVAETMRLFVSFGYEKSFFVHDDVRVSFRDAGHILGSASVFLEVREKGEIKRIAFSGDIGRPGRPILADPEPLPTADFVICESTYGDREHEGAPAELERFLRVVHRACIEKKGKLIIPAFAVGRTQEVVYMLDQLAKKGRLPRIPVFVDSPLAVNATEIFINHPECFDQQLHEYMATDADPFGFNGLQYVRSAEASKGINSIKGPAIVIASSGMMNAGRIRHHLFNNIENPRNTFLIVGYCSPDTPGGELRNGATFLNIFGENKQVLAEIEIMDSFSAHGDRQEMFEVLKPNLKSARQIFLVHGTLDRMEKWRDFLLEKGFPSVEAPELGAELEI